MADDLLAEARDFVVRRALIPNRMHPTDAQAEEQEYEEESLARSISTFARTAIASAVKAERERMATELDEKVLHDSDNAVDIVAALEDYIDQLRGEQNGQ